MAAPSGEGLETLEDMIVRAAETTAENVRAAKSAIGMVIFGQENVVERALITVLSGGHALLVGVPGLAKTKLVETMGTALGLDARRIQNSFCRRLILSDDNPGRRKKHRQAQHTENRRSYPHSSTPLVGLNSRLITAPNRYQLEAGTKLETVSFIQFFRRLNRYAIHIWMTFQQLYQFSRIVFFAYI